LSTSDTDYSPQSRGGRRGNQKIFHRKGAKGAKKTLNYCKNPDPGNGKRVDIRHGRGVSFLFFSKNCFLTFCPLCPLRLCGEYYLFFVSLRSLR
jgi:hypothetical protein